MMLTLHINGLTKDPRCLNLLNKVYLKSRRKKKHLHDRIWAASNMQPSKLTVELLQESVINSIPSRPQERNQTTGDYINSYSVAGDRLLTYQPTGTTL